VSVKKAKKITYEAAIAELEATVARLEQDEITLDESIELFARGVELTGVCNTILNEIEGRIVKLVENDGRDALDADGRAAADGWVPDDDDVKEVAFDARR
jgi:exodeoxyribonuclease VII small subunit